VGAKWIGDTKDVFPPFFRIDSENTVGLIRQQAKAAHVQVKLFQRDERHLTKPECLSAVGELVEIFQGRPSIERKVED